MSEPTFDTCSECGRPIYLNRYNKPVCPKCGKLTANGRKVLAPSPGQIATGAEEQRKLRKYPVNTEE